MKTISSFPDSEVWLQDYSTLWPITWAKMHPVVASTRARGSILLQVWGSAPLAPALEEKWQKVIFRSILGCLTPQKRILPPPPKKILVPPLNAPSCDPLISTDVVNDSVCFVEYFTENEREEYIFGMSLITFPPTLTFVNKNIAPNCIKSWRKINRTNNNCLNNYQYLYWEQECDLVYENILEPPSVYEVWYY